MIKAGSGGATTVIMNRRTAVFVARIKHVLVIRDGPQAQTIIAPAINFEPF